MADASGTTHWRDTSDYYWRIPAASGTLAGRIPNVIFARPSSSSSSPLSSSASRMKSIAKSPGRKKNPSRIRDSFRNRTWTKARCEKKEVADGSLSGRKYPPEFPRRVRTSPERVLPRLRRDSSSQTACSFSLDQEAAHLVEIQFFFVS